MPPSERVIVRSLTEPSSNEVGALAELFELYRVHHGQAPDAAESPGWLEQNLRSGPMNAFVAENNSRFVGLAVTVEIPASLRSEQ